MSKLFAAAGMAIALGLASLAVSAQTSTDTSTQTDQSKAGKRHHKGHRRRGGWKKLNLTDDQKAKLGPVLKSQRDQMSTLRNDSSLNQEQRQQKMLELRKSTREQMASILTPEQLQQMQQGRQYRHKRGGQAGTPNETAPQNN